MPTSWQAFAGTLLGSVQEPPPWVAPCTHPFGNQPASSLAGDNALLVAKADSLPKHLRMRLRQTGAKKTQQQQQYVATKIKVVASRSAVAPSPTDLFSPARPSTAPPCPPQQLLQAQAQLCVAGGSRWRAAAACPPRSWRMSACFPQR